MMPVSAENILRRLTEAGLLSPYAWHFAATVMRLQPYPEKRPRTKDADVHAAHETLFLSAALCAHQTLDAQHVCLELRSDSETRILGDLIAEEAATPSSDHSDRGSVEERSALLGLPLPRNWPERLSDPACAFAIAPPGTENANRVPLILESDRLYLQRYWRYEQALANRLRMLISLPPAPAVINSSGEASLDPAVTGILKDMTLDAFQMQALRTALAARVGVITGGPGTGKTTLIALVLARLLEHDPGLRVTLCAPTGKAQARMQEALRTQIERNLRLRPKVRERLLELIPSTVHRLLGYQPARGRFTRNAANPLQTDLLILDEASMAPLPLLFKLLDALPNETRVLLLGDPNQLAAVETGTAFGDICRAWRTQDHLSSLLQSHRFAEKQGIANLSTEIKSGDAEAAWARVCHDPSGSIHRSPTPNTATAMRNALDELLQNPELAPFVQYAKADSVGAALAGFDRFRVLCAIRNGPTGLLSLNAMLGERLEIEPYGRGYPLMITANDYNLKLFNGDIGLCWPDTSTPRTNGSGRPAVRVCFPDPSEPGALRAFAPAQLPGHEPAFAMTVHKAQGSGFESVLLVLPSRPCPVLTREWLYTGLTRARRQVFLWADETLFKSAVNRPTRRPSGLTEKLTSCPAASQDDSPGPVF